MATSSFRSAPLPPGRLLRSLLSRSSREAFWERELFTCSEVKPNSPPCTLSLKDYSKNRRVDGTRSRQNLQPQLLLVSCQHRQDLKIQQKSSFSPNSQKSTSPRPTTEVIPRQPCRKDLANIKDSAKLISLTKTIKKNEIESLRKHVELLGNRPPQIDPSIAAVLSTLIETQTKLLDKQTNQNVIQITSTTHWSNELKLTNAISRLSGSAKNWQLTTEKNFNDCTVWKTAFASRFKRRITMQEFLAHQSERKMKHSETLVDYIYAKDALLEKAPFTISQQDRISMIIVDVTEEKCTHDVHLHKYNPTTDNIQDINCWQCGRKGHAFFMCHLPPPPRGSSVVRPSQFQELSSQANAPLLSSSVSINHGNNIQRGTTNLNSSDSRRNSNTNRNSTSGRYATTNPTNTVNCIKTQTNKRALILVVINNSIEIQALCVPCADITIIQQSCIPADAVIHPWTDGQFQVVDHKINPIEWISLNLSVRNIHNA
ncbi:putative gypsy-29-i dr [Trichonephila clavipes]|nr:putative gypsy-29-i dr [Trichonephila clavipes]